MTNNLIKWILIIMIFSNTSFANTQYFNEGLNLFKKKKYEEAKPQNSNLTQPNK